jgi:hypothetical protein
MWQPHNAAACRTVNSASGTNRPSAVTSGGRGINEAVIMRPFVS